MLQRNSLLDLLARFLHLQIDEKHDDVPVLYNDIRRALLRRFPYGIFYPIEPEQIVVLACFHARRDPKQWRRRR